MEIDEKYRPGIERISKEIGADSETAYSMLLLTAALMDLCPWDSEVADIVITDCKGQRHVDLRESESCP